MSNIQAISAAIAILVRTVANDTASDTLKSHKDSAAQQVRELVVMAVEDGLPVKQVAEAFAAGCKAIKKESRGKGYKMAMLGYGIALENGDDIMTGFGKDESKPMPIAAAQKIHVQATATDEEKARAQAVELVRERLTPWLKDGTVAELQAILDAVGVKAGGVKTTHAVSLEDAIGGFFADGREETETEEYAQAVNG